MMPHAPTLDWQMRILNLGERPSAFSKEVEQAPQPFKVKNVLVGAYDGIKNPEDHIMAYINLMYLQAVDDATWCRCFPATLTGIAQRWFGTLPAGSITNFRTLAYMFVNQFSMNIPARKTSLSLSAISQGREEGLRSYLKRFNLERIQIPGLSDDVAYTGFVKGLRQGSEFKFDLIRKQIFTLPEALAEAERYIQAVEFTTQEGKTDSRRPDRNFGSKPEPSTPKPEEKKRKEVWTVEGELSKKKKRVRSYESKYEFNSDCYSILMDIKDRLQFEKPQPMKGPAKFRDKAKYCHFHKDIGHETNDCISLKKLLDKLAAEGHLNSYVLKSTVTLKTDKRAGRKMDKPASSEKTDPEVVSVIAGGFASGGPTIKGAKNHARALHQVMMSGKASMPPFPEVTITEKDRGTI